jgi:hypothetical protein
MSNLSRIAKVRRSIRALCASAVTVGVASALLVVGMTLGEATPASAAAITPATLPNAAVGSAYNSGTLTSSSAATWSTTGTLPTGVALTSTASSTTDTITGTPTTDGTYNFTVTSGADSTAYTLTVTGIAPVALAVPSVGVAYNSGTMTVQTAAPWSTTGTLPTGLALTSNASSTTDTITGTPTAAGSFTFTVTSGSQSQAYTLVVGGISPTTLTYPFLGVAYNSGTMTEVTAATWSVSGALPTGLTLTSTASATTDTITGTPTVAGTYAFNVISGANSQSYTLIVSSMSPTSLADPSLGVAYDSGALTVATAAVWSTTGTLPPGLALTSTVSSTTDTITGTPTTAGTYTFAVISGAAAETYTLHVTGITPATLAFPFLNVAYNSGPMTVASAATWSTTGALPTGLALTSTASATTDTITGTPTVAGTFTFTVTSGVNSHVYTLTVATMSPTTLPNPTIGSAYVSGNLSVATAATWSISAGTLPPGLALASTASSTTDTITGTPTTPGTFTFTVTSGTASQAYTLVVTGITPTTLPNATVGTAYISGTMSVVTAATWSISVGTLPPGLALASAASATTDTIIGTPTTAGTFTFTVKSGTAAQSYTVVVTGITPTTLPNATAGAAYSSGTLTAPVAGTWSVSAGVLPVGLVLNASATTTDTLTGTPTTAGTYSFTVKSGTVTQSYSLVVLPPVIVFHASRVIGHVTAGKTVIITIVGAGFYGRPTVVSHGGTVALVTRDTGKQLTVRVAVARGSRNGTFTFTIRLANGHTTKVRYNQHA